MKSKRVLSLILASMMVFSLSACGGGGDKSQAKSDVKSDVQKEEKKDDTKSANSAKIKIRLASQFAEENPQSKTNMKFKEILESKSDEFEVEVYVNNQLGSAEVWNDMLIKGSIEMGQPGGLMAQSYPLTATVECPFLFSDWDDANYILQETDVFERLNAEMPEKVGVRSLGIMPLGFRVVTSNKKIESLDDFKGLRLRVPNVPFCVWFAESVNASVISMSMGELFTALEQGVVDAQENPYATILSNKLYEVQKYIFDSKHMFTAHDWYVNEAFWQSLTADQQAVVQESVNEAIDYCFEITQQAEKDAIAELEGYGVEIVYPSDEMRAKLVELQSGTWTKFYEAYPGSEEYIKEIKELEKNK